MAVPEAAVSFLLENLTQVLKYNYKLIADVRENIQKLQSELKNLKGLMIDFSKYNNESEYLKRTVIEIRSILCEAEDAVDSYLVQAAIQNNRNAVSRVAHTIDHHKELRDVAKRIEEISVRVKEMNENGVKNGFEALQHQAIVNLNLRKSTEAPKVEEEHVIGFDGAAEKVEELLTQGAESLEVISIVGMLGLGKTTLAKMVYKDPDVDYEYMIRAFVYVSREYEKKDVLLKILTSFSQVNDEVNKMDGEQLEKYIRLQLEGKQYLIVLDDVWEPEDWDRFKDAFPNNNKRCRVLITTRHEMVAKHANRHNLDALYRLDFLTMEQCRELLRWRVFRENSCSEELQVYEVKIAEKCDGLPLAVVVIAGILVNHADRVDWWRSVANSVEDYIAQDTKQTGKVIELMYKHLPNYLKTCFLYLGVFREDFEIPVWKLVRLWISEGLIQQEGNLVLEDIAEQYLEELVHRNLVMVGQRRSNDRIKTCHMHDALREFCKKEAVDENLFHEIKKEKLTYFLSGDPSLDQCRRLCINNLNVLEYISKTPTRKFVRSFLTFVKDETLVEAKLVPCIPKAFKLLRVLEIQSLIFSCFPRTLCNLVLLKYIAISSNFNNLPSAMGTLWNLQTLIVSTSSRTLEIKANIWKMLHFRHLHTNASTSLPRPGARSETSNEGASPGMNVQTLCTISPESCTKDIFDRTPTLKKLGIRGALAKLFEISAGGYSFLSQLRRLESLENLKLLNDDIKNKLYSLPSSKDFPNELTKLTLMNTRLEWKEMRTLGELENLEVVKLKDFAFQGNLWNTEKGGFRRLKHLYIGHTDLVVWEASKDHFPKLKSLELNGCDKLKAVPHGLGDIPSLQSMVLHCTNPQVASSARRLQVLKLKQAEKGNKQADKGIKHSDFKLSVYPPDH